SPSGVQALPFLVKAAVDTSAVFPSDERATMPAWVPGALASVHVPPLLVNAQTPLPPTSARLPSDERAMDCPCATPPVPTSLFPCWVQTPTFLVKTHVAPANE